ncbi:Cytochrome P450 26B1 [Manis pentadactyla]|nr:Cytochrome P450 26B1 [Manis pentadactyla]
MQEAYITSLRPEVNKGMMDCDAATPIQLEGYLNPKSWCFHYTVKPTRAAASIAKVSSSLDENNNDDANGDNSDDGGDNGDDDDDEDDSHS